MDWNAAKTTTVNIPKWETAKYHYVSFFKYGYSVGQNSLISYLLPIIFLEIPATYFWQIFDDLISSQASEGENERLARLQKEKAEADENFRNQIVIQNNIREFGEFKDDHFEVRSAKILLQGTSWSIGDQMVLESPIYRVVCLVLRYISSNRKKNTLFTIQKVSQFYLFVS